MHIPRHASLATRLARELRRQLKTDYIAGGRLPSEPEMAKKFGVSRGTVRQALTILEREGVIFRRQGSGTYVNKYALRIRARAETAYEFTELLRLAGFEADTQLISFAQISLPKDISEQLDVEPETKALSVNKLFLADGQPAIFCIDIIPIDLIMVEYDQNVLIEPIFVFLKNICGQSVDANLTEIIPEVVDGQLARYLDMIPGQPILRFDEIGQNPSAKPVLFSRIYFKDQFIRFSILRKKI